jgi:diguanylate cyclase (GGDEF)-like protein
MINALDKLLNKLSRLQVLLISILFILIIGSFDWLADYRVGFVLFYFIPIALLTWRLGRRAGAACAVLCIMLSAFPDVLEVQVHDDARTLQLIILWNSVVRLVMLLVEVVVVDKIAQSFTTQQSLALSDSLTGALNRRGFDAQLSFSLRQARRDAYPLAVAYLDLDNLKTANDVLGHETGDLILQDVAKVLRISVREVDIVARLGGDEFALILPHADTTTAHQVMERVKLNLAETLARNPIHLGCSIGVVIYPYPPHDTSEVISAADNLMYQAKSNGKDTIIFETIEADMAALHEKAANFLFGSKQLAKSN